MGAYTKLGDFSDAQALTETAVSTNTLDMEVIKNQVGVGGDIYICLRTNVAADFTTTDETYLACLEGDTAAASTAPQCIAMLLCDNDGTGVVTGDPESTRLKTAGLFVYRATLPYEAGDFRYLRLRYTLGGTSPTWTVDAWLQTEPPRSDRTQVFASPVGNP